MNSLENFRERCEALAQQTEAWRRQLLARKRATPMVGRRQRAVWGLLLPLATLLGLLGIALGNGNPAHAEGIQCGDVLGPGGRFELGHDLVCGNRGITIRDGAILDLNGHLINCPPSGCVILPGAGAQLLNGALSGGSIVGILLEGTGGHTVRNVTSTLKDGNVFVMQSDHNQLINVMAESVINPAFTINGHHNRLVNSIARCMNLVAPCISVRGDHNRLIENFATSTSLPSGINQGGGFRISGDHNVLRGNRAIGNEGFGIVVSGTGNRLMRNTALGNTLDLQDTSGDCVQNTWRQNTFRTSDPVCLDERTGEAVAEVGR